MKASAEGSACSAARWTWSNPGLATSLTATILMTLWTLGSGPPIPKLCRLIRASLWARWRVGVRPGPSKREGSLKWPAALVDDVASCQGGWQCRDGRLVSVQTETNVSWTPSHRR
jgi:hypothetical protein